MNHHDALEYLLSLPRFTDQGGAAYRPGLDRMQRLMAAMGYPHEAFESVHVAGTNGKGSTASLLASVASAAGRRVGLHTSPHLFRVTERMRIDGAPASEAWLADAVSRYREVFEAVRPSFFEATVALSFLYFAEEQVDLGVVEVGMGGRLDATNILRPRLALITNIGLDHAEFLGSTVRQVAREKAGIIKAGTPVLTTATQPEAVGVMREVAAAAAAPLHLVREEACVLEAAAALDGLELQVRSPVRRYDGLRVGLTGLHQQENALLALRAAELLFEEVRQHADTVYIGLAEVRQRAGLRGRLDVLQREPLLVADVAHNPEGLAPVLHFMKTHLQPRSGKLHVLLGAMRDKDIREMAHLLSEASATVFPVTIRTARALPAPELAGLLALGGVAVAGAGTLEEGLAWLRTVAAPEHGLLVTGSHQVVAQLPESLFSGKALHRFL